MSIITQSKRISSKVLNLKSNKNIHLYSSVTTNPPRESIISSSSSILSGQSTSSSTPPETAAAATTGGGGKGQPWSFLKFSLVAAVTGGVATAGYATYGECSGKWYITLLPFLCFLYFYILKWKEKYIEVTQYYNINIKLTIAMLYSLYLLLQHIV